MRVQIDQRTCNFPDFKLVHYLTSRHQTTIPAAQDAEDATLAPFLALLDKRLETHPDWVVPYADTDAAHDIALVRGVKAG